MITVALNNGETLLKIQIPKEAALLSNLMADMIQDDEKDDEPSEIPLMDIDEKCFLIAKEFMEHHARDPFQKIKQPISSSNLKELGVSDFDILLITKLDIEELLKLINTANYLDCPSLLDLGLGRLACLIKGKSPQEVRDMFKLEPNPTPEEEAELRKTNSWLFELSTVQNSTE